MGPVVMYTSCHCVTIVMTNCTVVSQKYSSACFYGIWRHNSINWHHNSSTMTTCNMKYTWLPCIQQQKLFEVLRIGGGGFLLLRLRLKCHQIEILTTLNNKQLYLLQIDFFIPNPKFNGNVNFMPFAFHSNMLLP